MPVTDVSAQSPHTETPPSDMPPPPSVHGLSSEEAARRLARDGANRLPSGQRRTMVHIILDVLREPMLSLLLVGGLAYLMLGSSVEALVLLCFACLSIVLTIVQEARTERALEALRDMAAPRAMVLRDGTPRRIAGWEVVPEDILVVEQGDRVVADAMLLNASELESDESLLTGESLPVRKRTLQPGDSVTAPPGGDDIPLIYAGTLITRGRGIARVVLTGPRTQMGRIGQALAALDTEAPRLRIEIHGIVRVAAIGAILMVGLVTLLFGLLRGSWLEAVLAGIALGMALLPEEFPVVLTVFLTMGAWRLARAGVLTRQAMAIEALGAATILCVDKTGTLTENRMKLVGWWRPAGEWLMPSTGAKNADEVLSLALLASPAIGKDPMEIAIDDAATLSVEQGQWTLRHSFPLTPELLAMSNVWSRGIGQTLLVAAKGAPEAIAALCDLAPAERSAMEAAMQMMTARGGRVLGIAEAQVPDERLPGTQGELPFRFKGLVALADPLRPDVPAAIAECRAAGVRTVMMTGDHPGTARAIARDAGLDPGEPVTGAEIERLDDAALVARLRETSVCARIMPVQKLRIVEALKAAGEVVAMTGDGVNDAPALKAAHIGIAMGQRGTDVAREAAALVLLNDNFPAIVAAIRLGRREYANLRKAIAFIISVHMPIAGLALLPLLTGTPILFGPIHIALFELIIDPVCTLVFESEASDEAAMTRPPRSPEMRLVSWDMVVRSLLQGGIVLGLLTTLAITLPHDGWSGGAVRVTVFLLLVAGILALVVADRAGRNGLIPTLRRGNRAFRFVLLGIALVLTTILTMTDLRTILAFDRPGPSQWLVVLAGGLALVLLLPATNRAWPRAGR